MVRKNDLVNRTKEFAYACVDVCSELPNSYLGNHVKGQLIRAATSVAANYRATCHAQSKPSFVSKLSIVVEECDETEFWIQLIIDKDLIKKDKMQSLLKEANELTSIFVVARRTASQSIK